MASNFVFEKQFKKLESSFLNKHCRYSIKLAATRDFVCVLEISVTSAHPVAHRRKIIKLSAVDASIDCALHTIAS